MSGVVNGDDVSAEMPTAGTLADKNAADGKAVTFEPIALAGDDAGNYLLTQPTVVVDIAKAPLQIVADDQGCSMGQEPPAFTFSIAGLVPGDDEGVLNPYPTLTSAYTAATVFTEESKDFEITLANDPKAGNYYVVYTPGTLTVLGRFDVTYFGLGGRFADGEESNVVATLVSTGYRHSTATRAGYKLAGWYDGWKSGASKVVNGQTLLRLAPHTLYPKWTSLAPTPNSAGTLALADMSGSKPVTAIAEKAYTGNTSIRSVTTPVFLQSIGARAFYQNSKLKSLTLTRPLNYADLKQGTLTIGTSAFAGCAIEELTIPAGVCLGAGAFLNNAKLKRIYFLGRAAISCDATAFQRCGYENGLGELRVYMSAAFQKANPKLVATIQSKNTDVTVRPLVGVSGVEPGTPCNIAELAGLAKGRVALAVQMKMRIDGTVPETVRVEYKASLLDSKWKTLATSKGATIDGNGLVVLEVEVPGGSTGFFRVVAE